MLLAAAVLALLPLSPVALLLYYIYFERSRLPDLERFIRFEMPTIGAVYDARGAVLLEVAREYRRIAAYVDVPPVLRHAILAAEDRNFFTHGGIEYRALPRVAWKTTVHTAAARELGIRTPQQPYITTALGASEVRLLELADVYRAMASGLLAEPHVIERITDASGATLYAASPAAGAIDSTHLSLIQEGLRAVIRLPGATAHLLNTRDFPIPVMGKTGTTTDFRDALFVGSTYGRQGVTVAVRIGFDDNRTLGDKETGGRTALPIFREVMFRLYERQLAGPVPQFPREIEQRIDDYLARQAPPDTRETKVQ